MSQPRTVLVTGATGKQGGAAARALVARGQHVRALTRRPDGPAAQALAALGVDLAPGSFDDRASLDAALRGVDALFAMGTPYEAGVDAEIRQGLAIVDAAQAAGTGHVVLTSVASADQRTGVPHFESKLLVEEHLRRSGLPFTILAPVYFMENLLAPWNLDALRSGVFAQALGPGVRLQQIAVEDIGRFAARVIDARDEYLGQRIDLAGDELTGQELVDVVSTVSGRTIRYQELLIGALRTDNADLAAMFEWFDRVGYAVDIARLRETAPEIGWHRFEDWAREQDWTVIR